MNYDINQTIEALVRLHDSGRNPQELMQMFNQNSGVSQVNQMKTQIQNMAQGRTPAEFILQIARQNGATEQNIQNLSRILGMK